MAGSVDAVVETAAQIEEGVLQALDSAGFLIGDDAHDHVIDRAKLRLAIFDRVIDAKVQRRVDRREKAITKGALTKALVPDADDEAVDEVGRKVYQELKRLIWTEVNTHECGAVQKLVGEVADENGLGYVLVRTKVSLEGNPTDAVYVTTDYNRIADDFTSPLGEAVTRAATKYAANATMLIKRGQNAKKVRAGLDAAMRNATTVATSTVDLALPRAED